MSHTGKNPYEENTVLKLLLRMFTRGQKKVWKGSGGGSGRVFVSDRKRKKKLAVHPPAKPDCLRKVFENSGEKLPVAGVCTAGDVLFLA